MDVQAGAVPKDGPSAGNALLTALVSLLSGHRVRGDVAMTGEITLSGLVLPIGGVKEKVLAARRAGIRRVILPRDNEKDVPDVPESARAEMEFVFADRIEEVLAAALPDLRRPLPTPGEEDGPVGSRAGSLVGSGRAGEAQADGR